MQKNYKVLSMHQFASHISKTLNNVFKKKAPTNVKGWKVEILDFIISKYGTFMRKKMINNNELHIPLFLKGHFYLKSV